MNDAEKLKQYEEGLHALELSLDIQLDDGNWNFNAYMHGFANALILARAFMIGEEPKFLPRPEQWLEDELFVDNED